MLIWHDNQSTTRARVQRIHYQEHLLTEEQKIGSIFVFEIPNFDSSVNKNPVLYINPQTKVMWYEYEDIPKTPEQLIEERLSATEIALANILGV